MIFPGFDHAEVASEEYIAHGIKCEPAHDIDHVHSSFSMLSKLGYAVSELLN
jgi:hypothetical protein